MLEADDSILGEVVQRVGVSVLSVGGHSGSGMMGKVEL